jgi:hypothetical protein
MLVELVPFNGMAVGLNNSANIKGLAEKLTRGVNRVVTRLRGARLRQLTRLGKHNVPHHRSWLHSLLTRSVPQFPDLLQVAFMSNNPLRRLALRARHTVAPLASRTWISRSASACDLAFTRLAGSP